MFTLPDGRTSDLMCFLRTSPVVCTTFEVDGKCETFDCRVEAVDRTNSSPGAMPEFDGDGVDLCRVIGKEPVILSFVMIVGMLLLLSSAAVE